MELLDTELTTKERDYMRFLLEEGEEVLWMTRPFIPWWSSAILPVGIFGLVWCGMLTKMCSCGVDWGMLPFALVGVALLVAPFLIYRYHKNSAYVLTNKYAHILRPGLTGKISSTSYPAGSNMVVSTEAQLDDRGSLIFGFNIVSTKHGTRQQPYGFLHTRKLAEAERIIATLPPIPSQAETKEPEPSKALIIVVASIFMLIGCVVLHFGGGKIMEAKELERHGIRTQATVCKLIIEKDSEGDSHYYPVFQFHTPDGTQHKVKGNTGSNPPAWKKGEQLQVIYPAEKPEEAVSDTFGGLWGAGVFLSAFGLIFIVFSSITLSVVGKKKAKKS